MSTKKSNSEAAVNGIMSCGCLTVVLVLFFIFIPIYRFSAETIKFTVTDKERTEETYLVWTEMEDGVEDKKEVFAIKDSWSFLRWNSSDTYGELEEKVTYCATVAGWRIPVVSWYRNIIELQKCPETL